MRILAGLVLFLSAIPQLSFARLGETLDECKSRYDSATGQISSEEFRFYRDHVSIIVHLRAGRSTREDFCPESGSKLSARQIADLLAENSEGSVWEVSGETPAYTSYFRKDNRASAQAAKPNTSGEGNTKLTVKGAELIIEYTSAAARALVAPE